MTSLSSSQVHQNRASLFLLSFFLVISGIFIGLMVLDFTTAQGPPAPDLTLNPLGGNVGIGTATPQDTLDVDGTIRAEQLCDESGANCKDISSGWGGGSGDGHSLDAADGDPTNVVFVDNSGQVGIGTISPSEVLDVIGNIHASGTLSSGNSITIDGVNDTITASSGAIGFGDENLSTTGTINAGAFAGDGSGLTDVPVDTAISDALCDAFTALGTLPPSDLNCPSSTDKIVFVTQGVFTGDEIKGLKRADALCQGEANAAGLEGVFKAWLSDEETGVISRFRFDENFTYKKANGTLVTNGFGPLLTLDENIDLSSPIDRDAHGNTVSGTDRVWTGTGPDGGPSTADCDNWTDDRLGGSSLIGMYGSITQTDEDWTFTNSRSCSSSHRLYCFQQ